MNFKRIGMTLVSLVLVVCLLINVSPIKAEAAFWEYATYKTLEWVVVGILAGLGIGAAVDGTDALLDCVTNIKDGMIATQQWNIDNDTVALYNPDLAFNSYYVGQDMVEWVRQWLYDNKVITETAVTVPENYCIYNGVSLPKFPSSEYENRFITVDYSSGYECGMPHYYFYSASLPLNTSSMSTPISAGTYIDLDRWCISCGWYWIYADTSFGAGTLYYQGDSVLWVDGDPIIEESSVAISVADGLESEYIAPIALDLPTGYADWASNAISVPNEETGETVIYYPIAIGDSLENTLALTQADVWQGLSTIDKTTDVTDPSEPNDDSDEQLLANMTAGAFGALLAEATKEILGLNDGTTISELFEQLREAIEGIGEKVKESVVSPLQDLGESIVDGVKNVVAPDEDYLTEKLEELRERFSFADSLMTSAADLKEFLLTIGHQPPVIYIDLGAFTGPYNIGTKVPFIDLTWYADYKPTVDNILSAFLWLFTIWRLAIAAPGIISGMAGMPGTHDTVPDNVFNWSGFSYQTKNQNESSGFSSRQDSRLNWGKWRRHK